MKSLIVGHLGHGELILPGLIAKGLAANDRAKVHMTVLQALLQHALHPALEPIDLSAECRAAGVDAKAVRSLIGDAREGDGKITAPGLAKFTETLRSDVETMMEAVAAGDATAGKKGAERWASIQATTIAAGDEIATDEIAALTSVPSGDHDSLHRLVMDLHKDLNRLSAACAEETVNGAHAYGLSPEDRPMVAAFMRGVDRTHALKFNAQRRYNAFSPGGWGFRVPPRSAMEPPRRGRILLIPRAASVFLTSGVIISRPLP
jgi:hypothetical protein